MVKKDVVRRAAALLRERNLGKMIKMPKQVFHITDDEGNSKNFVVRKNERLMVYTTEDVEAIMDALIYVLYDALRKGDNVTIMGFGKFAPKYMKERKLKNVNDGKLMTVDGHFIPTFLSGTDMRRAVQTYEQSLTDRLVDVAKLGGDDDPDEMLPDEQVENDEE